MRPLIRPYFTPDGWHEAKSGELENKGEDRPARTRLVTFVVASYYRIYLAFCKIETLNSKQKGLSNLNNCNLQTLTYTLYILTLRKKQITFILSFSQKYAITFTLGAKNCTRAVNKWKRIQEINWRKKCKRIFNRKRQI